MSNFDHNPSPSQILCDIAANHLGIKTLEIRNSDSLDFHDLSVWALKAALEAAFDAGVKSAQAHGDTLNPHGGAQSIEAEEGGASPEGMRLRP